MCLTKNEWSSWASFLAVALTLFFTYKSSKNEKKRNSKKSQIALRTLTNQLKLAQHILNQLKNNSFRDERIKNLKKLEQCFHKVEKYNELAVDSMLHWGDYYFDSLAEISIKLQNACFDKEWNMGQDTDFDGLEEKIQSIIERYQVEFEFKNGFQKTYMEVIKEKKWYRRAIRIARSDNYYKN